MNRRVIRRYFALASVGLLVLVGALAFSNLQGTYSGPAPILDPTFSLWTSNVTYSHPFVWNLEKLERPSDQVSVNQTRTNGRYAVEMTIFETGENPSGVYVGLSQTLDGSRLSAFFRSTIGIWFLKEPCHCDDNLFNKSAVTLGLEVNDGIHTISFVFSDEHEREFILPNGDRFVLRPAESGVWAFQAFNFTKEYEAAQWIIPNSLTFRILFRVGQGALGWHYAFLNRITTDSDNAGVSQSIEGIQLFVTANVLQFSTKDLSVADTEREQG